MQYKISDFNNKQVLPELRQKGIYKIQAVDGRTYVGSAAICFRTRWWGHLNDLKKNNHHCNQLQNIYNKYGQDYLSFSVLEVVEDKQGILSREQFWLDGLKADLNVWKTVNSPLGYKHPEESVARNKKINRDKASESGSGVKYTKTTGKFVVKIRICGKQQTLGTFKMYEEALLVRQEAESLFWSDEFELKSSEDQSNFISNFKQTNGMRLKNTTNTSIKYISKTVDNRYKFLDRKAKHSRYFKNIEDAVDYKEQYLKSDCTLRNPEKLAKSGHKYIKINKYGTYTFIYKPVRHIKSFKTVEEAITYRDNFLSSDNKELSPRRIASTGHKFIYVYKQDRFKFNYLPNMHSKVFAILEEAVAYKSNYLENLV